MFAHILYLPASFVGWRPDATIILRSASSRAANSPHTLLIQAAVSPAACNAVNSNSVERINMSGTTTRNSNLTLKILSHTLLIQAAVSPAACINKVW